MPRAIKNLDISLGLATIPVQLFTATSSRGVASHLLHAKCGCRIQMRLECPIHGPVPREETVRGFETSKDEYVRFEPEELKALEQTSSSALVLDSFVPEHAIGPVYFENTYYLGAGKNGERGYRFSFRHSRRHIGSLSARSPGAGRPLRLRSACTRTACSSSGSTSRVRSCPVGHRLGPGTDDPRPGAAARRAADQ
jgi:hypothetical protein